MNADGSPFLKEKPWIDFAQKHALGLIAINYTSDPKKMYGSEKQGYYWPEQGSGKALINEIKHIYKKDLPILIYGFSGGAQFTGRFIEWAPERIVAWAAYSAQFWEKPTAKITKARGIVACGDLDGLRWQPSFSFFYSGRELGLSWIWLSRTETGHHRSGKLEDFVRLFFESEIKALRNLDDGAADADIFADLATGNLLTQEEVEINPALAVPFRTKELYEAWKNIHAN